MKKVRVLREMPFAKVGEEFEESCGIEWFTNGSGDTLYTEDLIKDGWLEWVEEDMTRHKFVCSKCKQEECFTGEYRCRYYDTAEVEVVETEDIVPRKYKRWKDKWGLFFE